MFVGVDREQAVSDLLTEWDKVRADGRARLVLIEAETGWGKTRVVQEFYTRLAASQAAPTYWPSTLVDDAPVGSAEAIRNRRKAIRPPDFTPPHAARPEFLWLGHDIDAGDGARADLAINDLSLQIAAALDADIRRRAAKAGSAKALFRLASALAPIPDTVGIAASVHEAATGLWRLRRLIREPQPVGPEAHDAGQLAAFATTLRSLWGVSGTEGPPVVLALEDGHEARSATIDLCRTILADRTLPFLIVVCAQPRRPRSVARELADDLASSSRVITLDPLTSADLGRLVDEKLPPGSAAALVAKADGNPYHLELLLLVCEQRLGPGLRGLTEQYVEDLPVQIADLLEALWQELSLSERAALASFALLGPRTSREAHESAELVDALADVEALASGWMRRQPDLLRFLEVARWHIARSRAGDALDRADQEALVTKALTAVLALREASTGPSDLLDEMIAHLTKEATDSRYTFDAVAAGRQVLRWADSLRWSQNYADARQAAAVAHAAAGRALDRHRTRDDGEDLLVEVMTLECALARLINGRASRPAVASADELEDEARAVGDRRPDLLVLALLEAHRALRERGTPGFHRARALMDEARHVTAERCPDDEALHLTVRRAGYPWHSLDGDRVGATKEALACHEICQDVFGELDQRTIESLADAAYYTMRFDAPRSVAMRREVHRRRELVWGRRDHPSVALSAKELAAALTEQGTAESLAEAVLLSEESFRVAEAHFGPEHVRTLNAMSVCSYARLELAEAQEAVGNAEYARRLRAEALALSTTCAHVRLQRFPERNNWSARHRLAVAQEVTGNDAGLQLLRDVLEERLATSAGQGTPPTAEARWTAEDLARALRRRGRDTEARDVLLLISSRNA